MSEVDKDGNLIWPLDWENPRWHEADRVNNWRNYVSERLKELWPTFTKEQKIALAEAFDEVASNEQWD